MDFWEFGYGRRIKKRDKIFVATSLLLIFSALAFSIYSIIQLQISIFKYMNCQKTPASKCGNDTVVDQQILFTNATQKSFALDENGTEFLLPENLEATPIERSTTTHAPKQNRTFFTDPTWKETAENAKMTCKMISPGSMRLLKIDRPFGDIASTLGDLKGLKVWTSASTLTGDFRWEDNTEVDFSQLEDYGYFYPKPWHRVFHSPHCLAISTVQERPGLDSHLHFAILQPIACEQTLQFYCQVPKQSGILFQKPA